MADYASIPLLALIGDQNLLDDFQLEEAASEMDAKGVTAFQSLIDLGYLDEDTIVQTMCDHLGCESMDLNDAMITPELIAQLPAELAKEGQKLAIEYFNEDGDGVYPITVKIVGKGSLYDPENKKVRS